MVRKTLGGKGGKKREWLGLKRGKEAGSRAKRILSGRVRGRRRENRLREWPRGAAKESIHVWCCVCSRTLSMLHVMGTGLLV